MHALVVVAHPDPRSLTHAVAARLAEGVVGSGHSAEIADLMAEGFDPRFSATDHAAHLKQATPPADVLAEQARIDRADALALVYPVYWWSMPGLLKGWIDRVFANGWAYDEIPGSKTVKLLGRLPVHLIGLGGADLGTYERHGYADAMRTQIDHGIFDYCGAQATSEFLLPSDTQDLSAHLDTARTLGGRLFEAVGRREAADAA
jgi:NAD(P)H dehydrogenase (quinone)